MGKGVRPNCVEPVMHGLVIVMEDWRTGRGREARENGMEWWANSGNLAVWLKSDEGLSTFVEK